MPPTSTRIWTPAAYFPSRTTWPKWSKATRRSKSSPAPPTTWCPATIRSCSRATQRPRPASKAGWCVSMWSPRANQELSRPRRRQGRDCKARAVSARLYDEFPVPAMTGRTGTSANLVRWSLRLIRVTGVKQPPLRNAIVRRAGGARGSERLTGAAMTTSWTPSRDKRLLAQQAAGRTAAQIAKTLGVTRNAVIGRSRRLRGIVYQSDIDSWTRANAQRAEEARKRAQVRRVAQRKALRDLARAMARGAPVGKAMARAHKAGALWRQIGGYFGISQQAAYERAKTWTQRSRS